MFTKHIRKIIGTTIAAAAVPAVLFAGAGTAQAASTLDTASHAMGVTVEVHSTGSEGLCFYSAEPWKSKVECPVGCVDYFNPTY
jgi:hypothetical protein